MLANSFATIRPEDEPLFALRMSHYSTDTRTTLPLM